MELKYSAVLKNRRRASAKYWGRIREGTREKWVNLNTQDKSVADKWVARQKNILFQVNELEERGEPIPPELLAKLITIDTPAFAQKVASEPVSAPGGVLERWEADMRLRGLRGTTVATYTRCAREFLGDTPVDSLTADRVRTMFAGKSKLAAASRRFIGNAMRNLFGFLGRADLVAAMPKVKIDAEGDRTWFTAEQMQNIWMAATSDSPEATEQYRLYFKVLTETAARNTEARMLKWKDIHEDATVRFSAVHTKQRKSRTIPISWELYGELDILRGNPEDDVFPLVSKYQTVRYRVFKRALKSLGIDKGTLHDLRRSRAMEIYRKTGDVRIASRWLGDSEIIAMKHYLEDVSVDELRRAVIYGEKG
jgi:integrase